MKTYVKQLNSQIEEIILEMRKFLTPSKKIFLLNLINCLSQMNTTNSKQFLLLMYILVIW
jgi:hypothetical protein